MLSVPGTGMVRMVNHSLWSIMFLVRMYISIWIVSPELYSDPRHSFCVCVFPSWLNQDSSPVPQSLFEGLVLIRPTLSFPPFVVLHSS